MVGWVGGVWNLIVMKKGILLFFSWLFKHGICWVQVIEYYVQIIYKSQLEHIRWRAIANPHALEEI